MSFASSFELGMKLAEQQRLHADDNAIEAAGKKVAERNAERERLNKIEQDRVQAQLLASVKPTQGQQGPSTYQQGDSLGLQGYQTGNKPVQTTVPTAPAGYMTRGDNMSENDLSPGGLDYPSANPATEQTLLGNYGTTAAFRGETPTQEDSLRMQQEPTQSYDTTTVDPKTLVTTIKNVPGPFTGENKQVNNLTDLAANKPETPQEAAKPKLLDTLNETITAAQLAKKAYQHNMEVLDELHTSGNTKAALAYGTQVANTQFTMAQAEHTQYTTLLGTSKMAGDTANNALESMKEPGADVSKIYLDWAHKLRDDLNYTGKIPFSLDPKENIKTLQQFQKDSQTTQEKAELGLKAAIADRDSAAKYANTKISEGELYVKQVMANLAFAKENREQNQTAMNMLSEGIKLKQKIVDSLNSVQDKDLKAAYSKEINDSMVVLNQGTKALGIKVNMGTPLTNVGTTNVKAGTPGDATPQVQTTEANPNQSTIGTYNPDIINKGIKSTAGGYETPTPKTPAQEKKDTPRIKFLQTKINELKSKTRSPSSAVAISNPFGDVYNLGEKAVSSIANSDILNPLEAAKRTGQKEREREAKELKKYQDELDKLTQ
jgi:hypothetical protein